MRHHKKIMIGIKKTDGKAFRNICTGLEGVELNLGKYIDKMKRAVA